MTNAPAPSSAPTPKLRTLAQFNARKNADVPFWFDFLDELGVPYTYTAVEDGKPVEKPVRLAVLGQESETVQNVINAEINARRKRDALQAVEDAKAVQAGGEVPVTIRTIESDIDFGQIGAAVRLVGWEGIEEPFTAELGAALVRDNSNAAKQVLANSNRMANFTKVSPPK